MYTVFPISSSLIGWELLNERIVSGYRVQGFHGLGEVFCRHASNLEWVCRSPFGAAAAAASAPPPRPGRRARTAGEIWRRRRPTTQSLRLCRAARYASEQNSRCTASPTTTTTRMAVPAEEELLVVLSRSESSGLGFSLLGKPGLPPIIYNILEDSPAAESGEVSAAAMFGRSVVVWGRPCGGSGRPGGVVSCFDHVLILIFDAVVSEGVPGVPVGGTGAGTCVGWAECAGLNRPVLVVVVQTPNCSWWC